MIELEQIKVTFPIAGQSRPYIALNNLDLSIEEGEYISVVGTNGAGKSTLLNILAGSLAPSRGRMRVDGKDVTDEPDFVRSRWLARVFPDPKVGTCDQLTIEENMAVALGRQDRRGLKRAVNSDQRRHFAERLAELNLGLESRMSMPVHLLSSGQRQSITVVMATLASNRLLLLDEHVANLDPRTQHTVMALSDRVVRERGISALMVTHDIHHALKYGERLIALKAGRVILDVRGQDKTSLTQSDLSAVYEDEAIV